MGNASSQLLEEHDALQKSHNQIREAMLEMERQIKRLERENHDLRKEIKKYEKQELLSLAPRAEKEEDIL